MSKDPAISDQEKTAHLSEWMDRCAIGKCEGLAQDYLEQTCRVFLKRHLRTINWEDSKRLFAEYLQEDPQEDGTDRAKLRRVALFDQIIYASYNNPTPDKIRKFKTNWLKKLDKNIGTMLTNVSSRLRNLIAKNVNREIAIFHHVLNEETGRKNKRRAASQSIEAEPELLNADAGEKPMMLPDGVASRESEQAIATALEALKHHEPLTDEYRRALWGKVYPDLAGTPEGPGFFGVSQSQIYKKQETGYRLLKSFFEQHAGDLNDTEKKEVVKCYFHWIESNLQSRRQLPEGWGRKIARRRKKAAARQQS